MYNEYNFNKYKDLRDYSSKLHDTLKCFDRVLLPTSARKYMSSLNVTLLNIQNIISNIVEIQRLENEMQKLTTLDSVAKKDNKSAKKAQSEISSIKADLYEHFRKLQEEFLKEMLMAERQYWKVSSSIDDQKSKENFHEKCRDFLIMAGEARDKAAIIPFAKKEKSELEQDLDDLRREKHIKEEQAINKAGNKEQENIDELEDALKSLSNILSTTSKTDLSEEIRREVKQIKKALPPKTVYIAKAGLERLRHSSQLLLDLERMNEIMASAHRFVGKDGKLQKINKQLDELKPLIQEAIHEEKEKQAKLGQTQKRVEGQISYATEALRTYDEMLRDNKALDQEQSEIIRKEHYLINENKELEQDEKESLGQAYKMQAPEYADLVNELEEKAEKDREKIKSNNIYMQEKVNQRAIKELPQRYKDMKRRLQEQSSLLTLPIESPNLGSAGKLL